MERRNRPVTVSCTRCEETVEQALRTLDGVTRVDADHERDAVGFVTEGAVDADAVKSAIERAGFDVTG